MTTDSGRVLPRPFEMHWGGGMIVEEAVAETPYVEPTIQLLQYNDGSLSLRFCYYHGPRFGRGPMMIDEQFIPELAASLRHAPRIKSLLKRLVDEAS